jgi:hypothetical protein
MILLKVLLSMLVPHVMWLGLVLSPTTVMWLPQDDLQDSSSFSSPSLVLLVTFTQLFSPNTTARTVLRVESQLRTGSRSS